MRFLNRVLQGIDRLFDLEGSQLPTNMIESDPLQAVFDTRTGVVAERSDQLTRNGASNITHWNGLRRFTIVITQEVTANNTNYRSVDDPFARFENTSSAATENAARDDVELWLTNCWAFGGASWSATLEECTVGVSKRSLSSSNGALTELPPYPIRRYTSSQTSFDPNAGGGVFLANTNNANSLIGGLPLLLQKNPNNGLQDFLGLLVRVSAGAAAGQYLHAIYEIVAVPRSSNLTPLG